MSDIEDSRRNYDGRYRYTLDGTSTHDVDDDDYALDGLSYHDDGDYALDGLSYHDDGEPLHTAGGLHAYEVLESDGAEAAELTATIVEVPSSLPKVAGTGFRLNGKRGSHEIKIYDEDDNEIEVHSLSDLDDDDYFEHGLSEGMTVSLRTAVAATNSGVDLADVTRLLDHVAGRAELLGPYSTRAADCDENGELDLIDAMVILEKISSEDIHRGVMVDADYNEIIDVSPDTTELYFIILGDVDHSYAEIL